MTKEFLTEWLREQSAILDGIIAASARDFYADTLRTRTPEEFGFDLAECQQESWNLTKNQDLCYDRPNTPLVYSLWYHGRRVNTFLSHFTDALWEAQQVPYIELFDLGAGTGAVQWAVGMAYHKMREWGISLPRIKIINVDTSPFMLHFSRNYLWKHFTLAYPYTQEFSPEIEYAVNSWNNERRADVSNPWITASYLFDISDVSNEGEYKKAIRDNFQKIVETFQPSKILLITAKEKEGLLDEAIKEFSEAKYVINKIKAQALLLKGFLISTNRFRNELYQSYQAYLSETRETRSLNNKAYWEDPSFIGCAIDIRQQQIFGKEPLKEGIKLHAAAISVRHEVELNDEQKDAARNTNHSTVIMGPAGCGKSIVITERIRNIVKEFDYAPDLRILLTTFNKELLVQLHYWLLDVLHQPSISKIVQDAGGFKIFFKGNASRIENIRILHFDMLPSRLGDVWDRGSVNLDVHKKLMEEICQRVKKKNHITDDQYDSILNPDFLLEEYIRVIFGLQIPIQASSEEYLNCIRRGRGIALNKERRQLVWQCLAPYEQEVESKSIASFTNRRQRFLNKLKTSEHHNKYDFILVDEFQDCTKADFEIFFSLLRSPNSLIISGDLSQSIQLGKSANVRILRDAIRADREMNDISWYHLKGSYRLPFRICEAIRKISEHIHQSFGKDPAAEVLTPYKGAPPGARPIVVYAENEAEMANKIHSILQHYSIYELQTKCILETDEALMQLLKIETSSVLKKKGMEKHCIIWSTRSGIIAQKERFEFVHTILSRTSSILIIALFDGADPSYQTQDIFKDAIGLLHPERLIFWDKETKRRFALLCHQPDVEELFED